MNLIKAKRRIGAFSVLTQYSKKVDIAFGVILAAMVAFMSWRATVGFGIVDESFYLTIPYRLLQGDSLFGSDWHVSQLSAFVQYLPMKLFVSLNGSADGVVLYFRYVFILFQSAVSCFAYLRLRKKCGALSIPAVVLFFLFLPMNIITLSYYTESLMTAEILGVMLYTMERKSKLYSFFLGVVLALLVLSEPLEILIYVIYCIVFVILAIKRKKGFASTADNNGHPVFSFTSWLFITIGAAAVAVCFFAFLFSRISLSEILRNLPYYFTDSEYVFPFLSEGKQNFLDSLPLLGSMYDNSAVSVILLAITAALFFVDRKRREHAGFHMLTLLLWTVVYSALQIYALACSNFYVLFFCQIPMVILGFYAYILLEKKDRSALLFMAFSLIYSVILAVTTAIPEVSAPVGYVVVSGAAIVLVAQLVIQERESTALSAKDEKNRRVKQKKSGQRDEMKKVNLASILSAASPAAAATAVVCTVLCLQLLFSVLESTAKISFEEYYGELTQPLDIVLDDGPMKGIRTSQERKRIYDGILSDLDAIEQRSSKPIYVSDLIPWTYLCTDLPLATYSAWFVRGDTKQRLTDYYTCYPERIPGSIYIPKVDGYSFLDSEIAQDNLKLFTQWVNGTTEETEFGYIIYVDSINF